MKTFRIGISGTGFGVKAHLPALLAHPRFEVVALASPTSAKAIAAERKIPHAFASAEEMIEGCELDAITIASPPFTHRDAVLAALDAGLHVMCEKPFALNVEEAEEMVAASRDAGTACGIAHEFRFVPQRQAIKELIVNGHLNPLREVEITHLTTFLREDSTARQRGWWFEREKGGGMANAIFSHLIDGANWAVGRAPHKTYGFLRTANKTRHDDRGEFVSTVDDGCFALLDYGDGLVARLTTDATEIVESFTFAVFAENRTAVASGPNAIDTTLYSIDADETNELQCKPSAYAKFASILPNVPYLMELYDEFVKQIETGESALPTFQDGLETQRVLAAIGYSYPT
ncbi:MAG: Gfo/Idh/MocA family oxidoreductase [Candidatus Aquilonibacter sp.]